MADVHVMPPRGHYFANEVGQLAGVSGETIGQPKVWYPIGTLTA